MTGRDDSAPPRGDVPQRASGSPAGEDVLEQGGRRLPVPPWRPPLTAVVLAAVALLAGLVAGYAAGARHARNSPSAGSRSAAGPAALAADPVIQSVRQCSAQAGHALQLGVQVTNQSAAGLRLLSVRAILPLGGLTTISQAWGPCGELPAGAGPPDNLVPAGASTWFTVTFQVLVRCPAALPVQFILDYDQSGRLAITRLPGFVDLGQVPYASCSAAGP